MRSINEYKADTQKFLETLTPEDEAFLNEINNSANKPPNSKQFESYDDIIKGMNEGYSKFTAESIDSYFKGKYHEHIDKLPRDIKEKFLSVHKDNR